MSITNVTFLFKVRSIFRPNARSYVTNEMVIAMVRQYTQNLKLWQPCSPKPQPRDSKHQVSRASQHLDMSLPNRSLVHYPQQSPKRKCANKSLDMRYTDIWTQPLYPFNTQVKAHRMFEKSLMRQLCHRNAINTMIEWRDSVVFYLFMM